MGDVLIVGSDGGAAVMQVLHDEELDMALRNARANSIAGIISGFLIAGTFWAAYGWPLILGVTAITCGCVGFSHVRDNYQFRYSDCCCMTLAAMTNLANASIAMCGMAVLATITSFVAAGLASSTSSQIAAVICGFACLHLVTNSFRGRAVFLTLVEKSPRGIVPLPYPMDGNGGQAGVAHGVPIAVQSWEAGPPPPPPPPPQQGTGVYPHSQQQHYQVPPQGSSPFIVGGPSHSFQPPPPPSGAYGYPNSYPMPSAPPGRVDSPR
jgi:hypothetical protein